MKVEELQNSLEEDVQRINERRWWKDSRTSSAGSTISRIKVQVNGTRKEKANGKGEGAVNQQMVKISTIMMKENSQIKQMVANLEK